MLRSIEGTVSGQLLDMGTDGEVHGLAGARLVAGAANATAILQDDTGTVLANLAAPANSADEFMPSRPVAFDRRVWLTITGAGAKIVAYV